MKNFKQSMTKEERKEHKEKRKQRKQARGKQWQAD